MPKITAYSYVRWSSGKQRKGSSKDRQIAETRAWIGRQKDMVFADLGIDDGVSASTGKNVTKGSKLITFIEQAETGSIKTPCILVVEQLDRITRLNAEDALALFLRMFKAKVWVASTFLNQTFKGLKGNDGKIYTLIGSLLQGHEYAANLSKRSQASWKSLHAKAKSGKIITPSIPFWLTIKNDKFTVKSKATALIKDIFKSYLSGKGADTIAKDLNERSIPSPATMGGRKLRNNKARWTAKGVTALLSNQNVIGNLEQTTRRSGVAKLEGYINGYYPAIVDKKLFDEAQKLKSKNRRSKGGRKGLWHHCLRNVLVCAECGASMRFYGHDPFFYVACSAAKIGTGCKLPSKPIRYQLVLDAVCSATAAYVVQYLYEKELPDTRRDLEAELSINEQQLVIANENYRIAIENLTQAPVAVMQNLADLEAANKAIKKAMATAETNSPEAAPTFLYELLGGEIPKKKNTPENRQRFNNIINQCYETIEVHQDLRAIRIKGWGKFSDKHIVQYAMIDIDEEEDVRWITGFEQESGISFEKSRFKKLEWQDEYKIKYFSDLLD